MHVEGVEGEESMGRGRGKGREGGMWGERDVGEEGRRERASVGSGREGGRRLWGGGIGRVVTGVFPVQ